MILLKFLLVAICFGAATIAAGSVLYDFYLAFELDRILRRGKGKLEDSASGQSAAGETTNSDLPPVPAAPRYVSLRTRPRREIRWKAAAKFLAVAVVPCMFEACSLFGKL